MHTFTIVVDGNFGLGIDVPSKLCEHKGLLLVLLRDVSPNGNRENNVVAIFDERSKIMLRDMMLDRHYSPLEVCAEALSSERGEGGLESGI